VQRSDRGLDDVRASPTQRKCPVEQRTPSGDLRLIPARAILVGEQDELALVEAGLPPGVVEEHQREQALHLGLVGHQADERAAEADCLPGEVDSPAVALVEDQVDDREHGGQPVGQDVIGRDAEGDARLLDLALRARQPSLHRLRLDEESPCDLVRRQAA
jgi:hypothetical protein